jgi:hypothetical protein
VISGFRRDVDEICGFLGYYAAYFGSGLPTFPLCKLRKGLQAFFSSWTS